MFYIYATYERDIISANDNLLARRDTKGTAIKFAKSCDSIETYIMNSADMLVWQSWPDVDAAIARSS